MTRRLAAIIALAMALLGACGYVTPSVDDPGEAVGGPPAVAQGIVEGWFDDVILGSPDLGWRFIYPSLRESVFGSEEDYRASLLASDWSQVSYRVDHVGLRDGEYSVFLELRIDGEEPLPAFLERWGFMQFSDATEPGVIRGFVAVRLGVGAEPSGIQPRGPDA